MSVSIMLCTAPEDEARSLSDRLLEQRLVACVNLVGPIESRYRWEGAIEVGRETLMVIKTASERTAEVRDRLLEWHSYDTPEVLELGVASGAARYLDWVLASTR